uniref:Uncharacterized protein n=1 Tax=Plectus sambesii TaxID=2011161 RepID=A0A914X154_9BILA
MTAPEVNGCATTEQKVKNSSSSSLSSLDYAFKRSSRQEEDWNARLKKGLTKIFDKLVGDDVVVDSDDELGKFLTKGTEALAARWRTRDGDSEIAFQGLLLVLEYCLADVMLHHETFEHFVSVLGFQSVAFWRRAVPFVYDSDFASGTKYRDALIFSLALYDVNSGQNRLRELYAAVPGVRQSLLGIHAKRFGEKFHHMQRERNRAASRRSSNSSLRSSMEELNVIEVENDAVADDCLAPNCDQLGDNMCSSGGLADTTHFQQRVINVSNAPPVSLARVDNGQWKIKQGSGGLVTCVDPVM